MMPLDKPRSRLARILVVEDNASHLRLLLDLLESEEFDALGCTTASEGLEHVKRGDVGVAIIDLRLPDLSGTQLLELLRAKHEHIRVIIYTGQASYESAKEALNLGAFAYVEKGTDPGELLRQVHRALWNNFDRYAVDLEDAIVDRDRAQQALQRAHNELDLRVKTRTAQLNHANETLQAEILERKRAEEQVRTRLRYEEGLAALSQSLLGTCDPPKALAQAIKPLLRASEVSRVYIFENFLDPSHGLCMRQIVEVCEPGVRPEIDNPLLQYLPYSHMSGLLRDKLSKGTWYGGLVGSLPPEDRAILEPQDIRSILILPVQTKGDWHGFIGFDDCHREHVWNAEDIGLLHTAAKIIGGYLERKQAQAKERSFQELFQSLSRIQSQFIAEADPQVTLDSLLKELLALTHSEYGFIGEVLGIKDGKPYLKTRAISNIAWDEDTRALFEKYAPNLEFFNLNTLFGQVITSGQPVIANSPSTDPRRGGLPKGHPPLHAFLGMPFFHGDKLVGMVGIANRFGGYDADLVGYLQPFLATCANIIEAYKNDQLRRQAEEALRASEERFRQFAETVSDVFWIRQSNPDRIFFVNNAFERVWGHTVESVYHNPHLWEESIHSADRQRVRETVERWVRAQPDAHLDLDYRIVRTDGHIRWIHDRAVKILDADGRPCHLAGVATDITQRKRIEEALREREQQLLKALEDRETICQDLHDGVLQSLYAVGLALETSKTLIHENPATAMELMQHAIAQLNSLMREIRHFIAGVDPQPSQPGSFQATLETLLAKLPRTHPLQIGLSIDPVAAARLSKKQTTHLLYIIQEALSNSLRHGQARTGHISLAAKEDVTCLDVEDDGVGFDVHAVDGQGHGLGNMAARARKLGAELSIESRPGQGTRISFSMKGTP